MAFENLGILLWAGVQRALRGEIMSAGHFYELAIDTFLNLLLLRYPKDAAIDQLDSRRRLERRHPEVAAQLQKAYLLSYPERAIIILDLADHLLVSASNLKLWDKLAIVRKWCEEASRTQSNS